MRWLVVLSMAVATGCAPQVTGSQKPGTGDEGGPCYGNGTCNGTLRCKSNLCVDLGSDGEGGTGEGGSTGTGGAAGSGGSTGSGGSSAAVGGSQTSGGVSGKGGAAGGGGSAGSGGSTPSCVPNCSGRSCGPDPVCQKSCGNCAAGYECSAGACVSPKPLKGNGDTCSAPSECASGICLSSVVGEMHCYGTGLDNSVCGDTFDCLGGVCVPVSIGGSASVCITGNSKCDSRGVPDVCTNLVVVVCEKIHDCGTAVSSTVPASFIKDFNACVLDGCTKINNLSTTECTQQASYYLGGTAPCP